MRVIPFPSGRPSDADAAVIAELEAALDGDGIGPDADYWRELRAEVRSLPDPVDPAFAAVLEQRIRAPRQPLRRHRSLPAFVASRRWRSLALLAAPLLVLVAVVLTGALTAGGPASREAARSSAAGGGVVKGDLSPSHESGVKGPAADSATVESASPPSPANAGRAEAPGQTGARLQHLAASISLGAGSEGVQQIADRVGRVTVAAGGFVESSRVQVQQGTAGEALLTLALPSAKLSPMLAQLERIAPVRAETQLLEDITSEYDAAGARLSAARAERTALLRALAGATTPAAIESLHARIAEADSEISTSERRRATISHRASQALVEVTVLGEAHHAGGGLTLARGLDDAGGVLTVSLAVLVVVAAVLVPLGLLVAALVLAGRFWRRQRRERVLGSG
jgi:hypothetical protein